MVIGSMANQIANITLVSSNTRYGTTKANCDIALANKYIAVAISASATGKCK